MERPILPAGQVAYRNLLTADPAPWFRARSGVNADFVFDTAAGRFLVLAFVGAGGSPTGRAAMKVLERLGARFDDQSVAAFAVSIDSADEAASPEPSGLRWFWDFDRAISRAYGAAPVEAPPGDASYRPRWIVLDPALRVLATVPMRGDDASEAEFRAVLDALPPLDAVVGETIQAPILVLPGVFEPELCERLIAAHVADGGEASGFMVEDRGRTVLRTDAAHKVRKDAVVTDPELVSLIQNRVHRRVRPAIAQAYQFEASRMERYLVACYAAEDGGHFRAHRDNNTKGTAHRRFAVSINLNAEFEGGEIGFPEYGSRTFKPRPGAAVVFSCGLLHRVTPVTAGRRYAFLPFLYDEAAARLREQNAGFLEDGLRGYRA